MLKADVMVCLAAAIAMVAPCALADSAAHFAVSSPAPPGCQLSGPPPFFPPPMGFARGGAMMWTGPGGGPPMPPPPDMMPFLMMPGLAGLTLSDEQIESMAALQRSFRTTVEPTAAKMHQLEDALQHQLFQDNIDTAKVKQLQEQLQDQRRQLEQLTSEHMLQMAQALTPEQRKKVRLQGDKMTLGPVIIHRP